MKIYKTIVTSGPSVEPLDTPEANTHLRLSGQDSYVDTLIKTARIAVERYLNRALITTTFKGYADKWAEEFYLPFAPLQSVTSVSYYNTAGTLTLLNNTSNASYWVSTADEPGEIEFVYDFVGPELQEGRPNAIEIVFVGGYGATADSVPEPIKHAMKLLISNYYEHTGDIVVGATATRIPNHVADLLHPYKLYNF
jgi:uncharacterized phiE125 gp8 family phage protein